MTDKIRDVLASLDVSNDNHWTSEGLPKLETVRFLAGDQTLTREQVTKSDPTFSRAVSAQRQKEATEKADGNVEDKVEGTVDTQLAELPTLGDGTTLEQEPELNAEEGVKLADKIRELQEEIADLKSKREELDAYIDGLEQRADSLINLQSKVEPKSNPIIEYLAMRQNSQLQRAENQLKK